MLFIEVFTRSYYRARFLRKLAPEMRTELSKLSSKSTVVDFGANIGLFSELAALKGAKVHAFEPGVKAFSSLQRVANKYKQIVPYNFAAGTKEETAQLYSHRDSERFWYKDYTPASSLMSSKPNVDVTLSDTVKVIDAARFLLDLPSVDLLKIDIEGYETELVPHLVREGALDHVKLLAIETHELKWPELERPTRSMLESLETLQDVVVRTDWI